MKIFFYKSILVFFLFLLAFHYSYNFVAKSIERKINNRESRRATREQRHTQLERGNPRARHTTGTRHRVCHTHRGNNRTHTQTIENNTWWRALLPHARRPILIEYFRAVPREPAGLFPVISNITIAFQSLRRC